MGLNGCDYQLKETLCANRTLSKKRHFCDRSLHYYTNQCLQYVSYIALGSDLKNSNKLEGERWKRPKEGKVIVTIYKRGILLL